jgi:hypothetical protein
MTTGEMRVRVDFNVSGDNNITLIKKRTAEIINVVEKLSIINPSDEKDYLVSKAIDAYELAAMYAVKALTTGI